MIAFLLKKIRDLVKRHKFPISIVVSLAILGVILYFPLHAWRHPHHVYLYPYDKLGAWLQGALTPMLLGVAIVTWLLQEKSSAAQIKLAHRTFVLENISRLYGHLNYSSACALVGPRLLASVVPYGNLQCLDILLRVFEKSENENDFAARTWHDHPAFRTIDEIKGSEEYRILEENLKFVGGLIQQSDIALLVDSRVLHLMKHVQSPA